MKRYTNILLAVLLTASLGKANTYTSAEYTFTIHIGAFIKAKLTDFENIRPYGYMYTQKFNNLLQIYMGDYPTESDAAKTLAKIKGSGYPDAFITRRSLASGTATSVIQIGTEKVGSSIPWTHYLKTGPLQTYQTGNAIRIVSGPFDNLDEAQSRLAMIKKIGFNDAFIKNINSVLLHKVTSFETGEGIQIPQNYETIVVPKAPQEEIVIAEIPPKKTIPDVMVKKKGPAKVKSPKDEPRPKTYDEVIVAKSPSAAKLPSISKAKAKAKIKKTPKPNVVPKKKKATVKTWAVPSISPKVKRTSVLKLQEVLKTKGTYKNSLDGLYGKGTKKSYAEIMASNKDIKRYKLLSQMYKEDLKKTSTLESIVFAMDDNIAAGVSRLQAQRSAIAKAYQAYGIYALSGKNKKTNRLMNQAIKASFANNKLKNKPPFDFKADYSYSDYGQLIKHMRYIHGASTEGLAVPCWLFEKHPKEAMLAFDPANDLTSGDYTIQDCGNIMDWESLNLLKTICQEMTPDIPPLDEKTLAKHQSKRAHLLITSKAQSIDEYKKIDSWNNNLWSGLAKWEVKDPLYTKMVTPLKVTYFHSWALLEDHFMGKGLNAKEARGLSLAVLQTIVEPHLERYSD